MQTEAKVNTKDTRQGDASSAVRRVTLVGLVVNVLLGVVKIVAGVVGSSGAMVADGIHSFSDLASDVVVLLMVGVSRHKPDASHPFGHGKFETMATVLLSLILIGVGAGIFWDGYTKVSSILEGHDTVERPGYVALVFCILSIVSKEWLYQYTLRCGKRVNSPAVVANAWHHRSDAFSSLATLFGVGGAIFLGPRWHFLDPLAAMVVALFIAGVGLKLVMPATRELLGAPLPTETIDAIKRAIVSTPGVITYHHLRTAKSGVDSIVDFHMKVNPDMSVREAHEIATHAEKAVKAACASEHCFVNIHIEPYKNESIRSDGSCE